MNTKSPQLEPGDVQPCPKADLVKAFDNYAKGFQDGYGDAIEKCTQAAQLFDGRAANAIRALAIPPAAQPVAWREALKLIKQLAWYYSVNDCHKRDPDDALEVPLRDLRAAYDISHRLELGNGPALISYSSASSEQLAATSAEDGGTSFGEHEGRKLAVPAQPDSEASGVPVYADPNFKYDEKTQSYHRVTALTTRPEIEKLRFQLVLAKRALEAIQRATINGEVCDDVAWFDQITTLHDFCDLTLSRLTIG